jgi:hypothetical protein
VGVNWLTKLLAAAAIANMPSDEVIQNLSRYQTEKERNQTRFVPKGCVMFDLHMGSDSFQANKVPANPLYPISPDFALT